MKISNDHCGQLCYGCKEPIHGTGLLADNVFDGGCASYHPDCYETSARTMYLVAFYYQTVLGRASDWITWAEKTVGSGRPGATGTILEEITRTLDNKNLFPAEYCKTCEEETVFYPNDTCSQCGEKK